MNHSQCTTKYETRNTPEFTPDVSSLAFLSGATVQRNKIYELLRTKLSERNMQNKPNVRKAKMNVKSCNTKDYQKFIPLAGQKNKPNLVRPALFAKELPD